MEHTHTSLVGQFSHIGTALVMFYTLDNVLRCGSDPKQVGQELRLHCVPQHSPRAHQLLQHLHAHTSHFNSQCKGYNYIVTVFEPFQQVLDIAEG